MPRYKLISDAALLDVVVQVIGERGPSGFTLADLGKQVGLSPATLIQRFGSKRDLVERAIGRASDRLSASVSQAPAFSGDAEAALVEWFVELGHPFRTRALIASHLVFLRRDLLDPALRVKASRHSRLVRQRVRQFLEHFEPEVTRDVSGLAVALEAHWHGLVIQWAIAGQGSLEAWLRAGLGVFLRSVRVGQRGGRSRRARSLTSRVG